MLSPFINMAINKHAGKILLPSFQNDFSLESRTHEKSETTSVVLLAVLCYSLRSYSRAGCSGSFFSSKFSKKTHNVGFHGGATEWQLDQLLQYSNSVSSFHKRNKR